MTAKDLYQLFTQLQTEYNWPNLYLAWQKPDHTLFMIGVRSGQLHHIMLYEHDPFYQEYSARLYNISPSFVHMRGPHVYDPVQELIEKTLAYQYLGSWEDPDRYMSDKHGGEILAHGRWNLAMQHIKYLSQNQALTDKISNAMTRSKKIIAKENPAGKPYTK